MSNKDYKAITSDYSRNDLVDTMEISRSTSYNYQDDITPAPRIFKEIARDGGGKLYIVDDGKTLISTKFPPFKCSVTDSTAFLALKNTVYWREKKLLLHSFIMISGFKFNHSIIEQSINE